MSENLGELRRKMNTAGDLQSVVRTMKALAASNIGQYQRSVLALAEYDRTIELGLSACFRSADSRPQAEGRPPNEERSRPGDVAAIVFGSDQGLVGQFNDVIADYTVQSLRELPGKPYVWAVGERVHARLENSGLPIAGVFAAPNSVKAITPLVSQIQIETETHRQQGEFECVYVYHNRPQTGALYEPIEQRLLPLDAQWRKGFAELRWPTAKLPEVMGGASTLRELVREYLFISLFRACAESLASENASRLAAMERAEKNIDELRERLNGDYQRLRQASIDEELFDVISGFEALTSDRRSLLA